MTVFDDSGNYMFEQVLKEFGKWFGRWCLRECDALETARQDGYNRPLPGVR